MTNKKYSVDMHCASCAMTITKALNKKGVEVEANPALKIVKVSFDESKLTSEDIVKEIARVGYHAEEK